MDIDAKELETLSHDLGKVGDKVLKEVEKSVFKGAMNVKKGMQDAFDNHTYFGNKKGLKYSVDFDMNVTPNAIEAEIGPKHGPGEPGNLANVAYFGTSRGGGTVDFLGPVETEAPKFEKAIGDVLKNVL